MQVWVEMEVQHPARPHVKAEDQLVITLLVPSGNSISAPCCDPLTPVLGIEEWNSG